MRNMLNAWLRQWHYINRREKSHLTKSSWNCRRSACWEEHKIKITLNHNTLQNLANGERSKAKANAMKSWLSEEEAEEVIKFNVETSNI